MSSELTWRVSLADRTVEEVTAHECHLFNATLRPPLVFTRFTPTAKGVRPVIIRAWSYGQWLKVELVE
jgi:hypothetical protein